MSVEWGSSLRRLAATTSMFAMFVVFGCTATADVTAPIQDLEPVTVASYNPLAQKAFYVDPTTRAAVAALETLPPSNELLTIGATPQVRWIGDEQPVDQVAAVVKGYVMAAQSSDRLPILALYAIPNRDCGGFSAGGFATGEEYRSWIAAVAAGLGESPAGVVLEPDALTAADCLPFDRRAERMDLLRYAVDMLAQKPNVAVYVDGGHSRWLSSEDLAQRLLDVGVDRIRGFSLNVSNFFSTAEEIAYGERVSSLTGGAHYVVDTSRNGNGPAPDAPLNWCNPPGRALGAAPTTATEGAHADAYLWIKHPGESDGECDRGDPPSGLFFVTYAVDLVRGAQR